MDHSSLLSNRDIFLITGPLMVMAFLFVFRFDQVIAAPRMRPSARHLPRIDENGEPILYDPDGRPSGPGRARRVPPKLIETGIPSIVSSQKWIESSNLHNSDEWQSVLTHSIL
jgi:hypothetical protein